MRVDSGDGAVIDEALLCSRQQQVFVDLCAHPDDAVVAISRSGTTAEVVDLPNRLGDVPALAVVGSAHPRSLTRAVLLE